MIGIKWTHFIAALGLVLGVGRAFAADAPPPSDPRDITGLWYGSGYNEAVNRVFKTIDGGEPPFTPAGRAVYDARIAADKAGHPIRHGESICVPSGFPGSREEAPHQIVQTPGQVTFIYETNHVFNTVYLNENHPKDLKPTFTGHSVGHWDGGTLVVDSIGFRPDRWLDYMGTPASSQLHVIERFRKINIGKAVLENTMTIIDPEMYTQPWTLRRILLWRPGVRLIEEICEEDGGQLEPGSERQENAH